MLKVILGLCLIIFPVVLGTPFPKQENELNDNFTRCHLNDVPTPRELVINAGYNAESHEVVTEDGYILQMDRITGFGQNAKPGKKPNVLLLHGLLDSSAGWVLSHPTRSLAFLLSNWGYQVWIGNVRGNRYSQKHIRMTTSDKNFWNFSWHEMGVYDLPAMIDYILKETKQEKMFFVGHSQGGTAFFVMASERPEYQEKLFAAFTLAPAVFMSHTRNHLFRLLAPIANNIKSLMDLIGLHKFRPSDRLIQMLGKEMCTEELLLEPVCKNIIFLMAGIDVDLNKTLVPSIAQYDPAGASTKQFVHYAQLMNTRKFRKYDHGIIQNLRLYGKIHPPEYKLANIYMPVYIHYSTNDVLVDFKDILKLHSVLPNAQDLLVPKDYAHLDFIWGNNVDSLVYNGILSLMGRYKRY